jgi:L-aspartate semialdehyde sulfurtransferase ferredoxin
MAARRIFVSVPAPLVPRPLVYEMIQRTEAVPSIRRANVEDDRGWLILELSGTDAAQDAAIAYLEGEGCVVDDMAGDVLAG